jgi:hypothetical protein
MVEYCFDCLSVAAGGDPLGSDDWLALVTREGEYLGLACSGCIADDDLALMGLEDVYGLAA